jgi:hypothetical protein
MSWYASMDDVPEPDGSLFFDIAYDCRGLGLRIILDGRTCYPTPAEGRLIAAALIAAADLADESIGTWDE